MATQANVEAFIGLLGYAATKAEAVFYRIPGSVVLVRYIKSSHRNDPGRTLLEVILIIFAIRTLFQSRTRADRSGSNFVQLTDQEIDELVTEWQPEPLLDKPTEKELAELANFPVIQGPNGPKVKLANNGKTVTNLTSYNFTGLAGNEHIKERAIQTLRKYGLGSCGPSGFYGTIDVHIELEKHIASFLGTEASILYSQGFATVSSVIPAFCKRGDIVVLDRGVNFAIHKGAQLSRSTIRYFDHNDLKSLEEVLQAIDKDQKKKKAPLTRRFIITEGIFENDGQILDLPKLIELKLTYKYRLILDESFSIGTLGRTGRGLTELYNVPASNVDMIVGSCANAFGSAGGFCAGSTIIVDHQRINAAAYVFSAALPALLAVSSYESINLLTSQPSMLTTLHENIRALRLVLDATATICPIQIPSHPASAIIHIQCKPQTDSLSPTFAAKVLKNSNPASITPRNHVAFDTETEEKLLQEVVDDAINQGVLIARVHRLRGQEQLEPRPSVRIVASAALSRKETEKAAAVLKTSLIKVLGKRR